MKTGPPFQAVALFPSGFVPSQSWRKLHFFDKRLRLQESDLLVEFRTKGDRPVLVYILWEHQTKIDPMMPWRLLCYRVEIWKKWLAENPNSTKFPLIHAVVLYQGKKAWNVPLNFSEMLDIEALELEAVPESQKVESEYEVVSLVPLSDSELPEDPGLRIGLSLMQAVTLKQSADWLVDHGEGLNEILSKPGGNAMFRMAIEYIFVSEEDEKKVLRALRKTTP